MRIAVVGKGGSGKTTTASVVARALARRGESVVALDGDTNANLGISLGLGLDATEALVTVRERLDAGEEDHAHDIDAVLERFGSEAPDGVRLAVVTRIESPEPGCPCCGLSVEQVLTQLEATASTVVADLEAGLGTLTRLGTRGGIDTVLVVVEPTPKSLEVGVRAAALARENGIAEILVVANRVQNDQDVTTVREQFEGYEVHEVPEDSAIVRADRDGVAPLDANPDAPAVRALEELADRLGLASVT